MAERKLTEGRILSSLAQLATPMLITAALQNVQSLIDLFWVGHLGRQAVAAVAMSGTILMVLFPLLVGVSTGTVALVARAIGAGHPEEASRAATQSLLLAVVLGTLSGVLGWTCSDLLFRLLGAAPEIIPDGEAYLRLTLLGSFAIFVLFIGNAALQGAGDAVTPMWIMATANLVNVVLDPVLIFGLGPFPRLGVRGAAVATVLAQGVAAIIALRVLLRGRAQLHLSRGTWHPDLKLCWRILRIGVFGSAQMVSRSLMGAVLMAIVAKCGTAAVAAYGVGMRFHMIILLPAFALGGAAATLVGQNLGAGKPRRAAHAAWLATGVDAIFMVLATVILVGFAPLLIHVFSDDAEVIQIGGDYLRIVSPFYVFVALGIVLGRALNGAGDTIGPMVITIITLWGFQVPLAILLSRWWQPPTHGIWWAMAVAFVVQGVLVAGWFMTGRWQKQQV